MRGVLGERAAEELVENLELDDIPVCPMCLFDLAWEMRQGGADRALVRQTSRYVWPEIKEAVEAEVVRARMREVPQAEDALCDLRDRGSRGVLARRIVTELAGRLAAEMDRDV